MDKQGDTVKTRIDERKREIHVWDLWERLRKLVFYNRPKEAKNIKIIRKTSISETERDL